MQLQETEKRGIGGRFQIHSAAVAECEHEPIEGLLPLRGLDVAEDRPVHLCLAARRGLEAADGDGVGLLAPGLEEGFDGGIASGVPAGDELLVEDDRVPDAPLEPGLNIVDKRVERGGPAYAPPIGAGSGVGQVFAYGLAVDLQ